MLDSIHIYDHKLLPSPHPGFVASSYLSTSEHQSVIILCTTDGIIVYAAEREQAIGYGSSDRLVLNRTTSIRERIRIPLVSRWHIGML